MSIKVLFLIIPFAYFSIIPNKQLRFTLVFLPYIALLCGGGLWEFCRNKKQAQKIWYTFLGIIAVLLLLYVVPIDRGYYDWRGPPSTLITDFYPQINQLEEGIILTADPLPTVYTDRQFLPYYFSIEVANKILTENKNKAVAILHISDAFYCTDTACREGVKEIEEKIKQDTTLKAQSSYGQREYFLYIPE